MAYSRIKAPDKVEPRAPILGSYTDAQVRYLHLRYPNVDVETLRRWVNEEKEADLKRPTCKILFYKQPGDCDMAETDLAKYIKKHCADVIAPCGTMFKCDPDNVPPSVKYNNSCRLDRKKFKKMMFECMEKGDMFGYQLNDGKQGLKKIKNNSIIGAHGFEGSPFYDKESFGAITSLGRNGVIMTYTLAEQCLANNFYWNDPEKIFNFVTTVSAAAPPEEVVEHLVEKYGLFIPTPDEAAKRLLEAAKYYLPVHKIHIIRQMVTGMFVSMSRAQRAYVFYRRNLINMFAYNDALFRGFIDRLRAIQDNLESSPDYQEKLDAVDPQAALKVPEDISMMLTIIFDKLLESTAVNRELVKNDPLKAKKFALIGQAASDIVDEMDELYTPFMYSGEAIAQVPENKYIIRKAVAVSDTDSILFTMKAPVSWYLKNDLKICQAGVDMSAYVVFILSRILNIANRDLAIAKGSVRENVDLIDLKSEFLYAVFIKTDLGKHYFTKYLAKEGRIPKKPKLDVKGVELQSSTLPEVSRKFASDLMSTILDDIQTYGSVYEADVVGMCLEYEKKLLTSLRSGSLDFYANVAIKDEDQYKNAERSVFFNYTLWRDVFEPTYGPIHVPGKYPIVPFRDKVMRSRLYLDWLEDHYPDIHGRYMRFLSEIPTTKNITRVPLPGTLQQLPAALLPAVDIRSIIYKNLAPAQLALKQLGISFAKQKQRPLFLDMYSSITDQTLSMSDVATEEILTA